MNKMDSKSEEMDPKALTQHYEEGEPEVRDTYVTPGM